jgi:hypothetical protein
MAERLKILVNAEMHPDGLRVLEAPATPWSFESDPGASHGRTACAHGGDASCSSARVLRERRSCASWVNGVGYDNVDVEASAGGDSSSTPRFRHRAGP